MFINLKSSGVGVFHNERMVINIFTVAGVAQSLYGKRGDINLMYRFLFEENMILIF